MLGKSNFAHHTLRKQEREGKNPGKNRATERDREGVKQKVSKFLHQSSFFLLNFLLGRGISFFANFIMLIR